MLRAIYHTDYRIAENADSAVIWIPREVFVNRIDPLDFQTTNSPKRVEVDNALMENTLTVFKIVMYSLHDSTLQGSFGVCVVS